MHNKFMKMFFPLVVFYGLLKQLTLYLFLSSLFQFIANKST